jgi:hypothetical protein
VRGHALDRVLLLAAVELAPGFAVAQAPSAPREQEGLAVRGPALRGELRDEIRPQRHIGAHGLPGLGPGLHDVMPEPEIGQAAGQSQDGNGGYDAE